MPYVINLIFDSNNISDMQNLNFLSEVKLRELSLTNNPIEQSLSDKRLNVYVK